MRPRRSLHLLLTAAALVACQPTTTRPAFLPYPEAARTEIRLDPPDATRRLAEALKADSIPIERIELRDGYLDSGWFDSETGKPVRNRPIGLQVVRVRAWTEQARPHATTLAVETVYRPLADPSRPDRELERPVPRDHAVAAKIRAALDSLVARFGGAPTPAPAS